MRWQLEASGDGTRLTLWTNIGRRFIAMGGLSHKELWKNTGRRAGANQ